MLQSLGDAPGEEAASASTLARFQFLEARFGSGLRLD